MDVFYVYVYGTAGWLTLQAVPLIFTPKVIVTMLSTEVHRATDLEIYFSRSLGFTLLTITFIVLFFTGTIPLSSSPISLERTDLNAPYALPIVRVVTLYHCIGLTYCYVRYVNDYEYLFGFALGAVGYGAMSAVGMWIMVFGTTGGRISKRTGADKRTTGWPFRNEAAYDKKKDRKMG